MPRPRRSDAPGSVLANIRRIIHAIHAQSSAIEAAVGLTGPQLWALREIDGTVEGLALGDVARKLALHKANAGRLVERLVSKGLVRCERPASDRRYVVARVTKKGRTLARRPVGAPAQADLLSRLGTLPPGEIERLDASLARLVGLLGAERVEPDALYESAKEPRRRGASRAAP
jgi:DNA-binding MarR family transcriptional regulator